MAALRESAKTAVGQCASLQPGESCLVVTDEERRPIGEAIRSAAEAVTEMTAIVEYPPGETHGSEPPAPVAAAMAGADVVFAPTTKSLTHTRARTGATDAGARVATLPGITEEVFTVGLQADYEAIAEHCVDVLEQIGDEQTLRVTTDAGTDVTFDLGDRSFLSDTGIIHDPGTVTNLPAGEVFVSPTSADGTVVVDGTMRPHGLLEGRSIRLEFEDGLVTEIDDDALRSTVEGAEEEVGEAARNVAELGIGTNVGVTELIGSVLLDEKAAGTIHVAIGDDAGIGGDVDAPIHLDGIVRDPTVFAGDREITLPG